MNLAQRIELWPLERLVPYARNARTHSPEQVAKIAASIAEFGFNNPVLVDSGSGIIAGHGRMAAARMLGLAEVPVIVLDHLSDAQRRAYVLADNRLALDAGWDDEMLATELAALQVDGFDLDLTGFTDDELADLLESVDAEQVPEGDPDEAPDPPAEPVTVLGDVWLLGRHRLMCGDSTSVDAVDTLMQGAKADMVFTDPPYGVEYQSNMRTKSEKFDVLANDDQFLDIAPIIEMFSTGWVFVWTSWKVQTRWIELLRLWIPVKYRDLAQAGWWYRRPEEDIQQRLRGRAGMAPWRRTCGQAHRVGVDHQQRRRVNLRSPHAEAGRAGRRGNG